jgi:hypothetical protein
MRVSRVKPQRACPPAGATYGASTWCEERAEPFRLALPGQPPGVAEAAAQSWATTSIEEIRRA